MSHTSGNNGQASEMERVIVVDGNGERVVNLKEEKRDDNGVLVHIAVLGTTGGRRFVAESNGLSEGEAVEGALRRFTVKDLAGGHRLDLEGNLIKGAGNKKKKKKPKEPTGSNTD